MNRRIFSAALLCFLSLAFNPMQGNTLAAQGKSKDGKMSGRPTEIRLGTPASGLLPDKTVFLYPKGQDSKKGLKEAEGPLMSNKLSGPEIAENNGFIANVTDSARIDLYFPEKPNGQMVIVCPGGSYFDLSSWNEGIYVASWMKSRGIATCVVKYRLPNGHWKVPLTDVQNAFRYCRSHAKEWGVDQIGVMGFSAGGHLASTVETMYVDNVTKPDFAVLIYPVISMKKGITHPRTHRDLLGSDESWMERDKYSFGKWYERQDKHRDLEERYSTYNDVTPYTPATFIALSTDDKTVTALNSTMFYQALVDNKVSAELHIYPRGGHGWGFTTSEFGKDNLGYARNEFSSSLERWLKSVHGGVAGIEISKPVNNAVKSCDIKVSKTVLLYPEGQNSDKGLAEAKGPGESNGASGPEVFDKHLYLSNVGDSARFDLYFPEKANGQMVVVCPGGGYGMTSQSNEGTHAAEWLLERGVSVCLMKYRLPLGHWTIPLTDVQNAFRYCRAHSSEWGVRQIGIMGFSAGGHLAASASTLFADDAAVRPDFSILFYPVITMEAGVTNNSTRANLLGSDGKWSDTGKLDWLVNHYSLENQVSAKTPATFIFLCSDDPAVPPENSIRYYDALLAHKVPAEIHCYPSGGHGFGFDTEKYGKDRIGYCRNELFLSLDRFLKEMSAKAK